jgi:hypothetical protein
LLYLLKVLLLYLLKVLLHLHPKNRRNLKNRKNQRNSITACEIPDRGIG